MLAVRRLATGSHFGRSKYGVRVPILRMLEGPAQDTRFIRALGRATNLRASLPSVSVR